MRKTLQTLILIFGSTITYGQIILAKTEKNEYKIDETITLVYEAKAKVDSVDIFSGTNFIIISGPLKSNSSSTINGKTTYIYTLTYEIKALTTETIEIISPTFYIDNQKHKAEKLILTISGKKLTDKEIDEIEFNKFKDESIKPNGTLRFVLSDKYGYTEEFKDFQWTFKRRLTKKELAKLRKK